MHGDGDSAGAGLTFPLLGGVFTKTAEVLLADPVHEDWLVLFATTVVDDYFEVHLGFATETVEVGQELALVGANGAAQGFVIGEHRAEAEGKHRGQFEAVGNDLGVVDGRFLDEGLFGIVFADDDSQVTCGIEENLISCDARHGLKRYWFAVTEKIGKSLLFTYAIGIPRHR